MVVVGDQLIVLQQQRPPDAFAALQIRIGCKIITQIQVRASNIKCRRVPGDIAQDLIFVRVNSLFPRVPAWFHMK